jgi:predicted transcriptional regulator
MAKTLELSDKQQEYLTEVLESVLGNLSYEISNTDLSSYKDLLKEKRDELKTIADLLKA